jgi:hypothetical protein
MKKILATFCAWLMLAGLAPMTAPFALAQSTIGASRVAGRFVAVNYNYGASAPSMGFGNPAGPSIPPLRIFNGNSAAGAGTITLASGYITMPDGRTFFPLCAGSTVTGSITCGGATPITVNPGGSNSETVTPTAVSGCNLFPQNASAPSCQVTATFANVHAQGEYVASGSAGLQEAINDAIASGGGMAVIDTLWTKAGGTQALATAWTAPSGSVGVAVEDQRSANFGYLVPAPGLTRIAAPTALTTAATATLTTATTGGTIATAQTPRFTVTAVDQFGGESAAADDSGATATLVDGAGSTNSYTITAAGVPTGTGIVGYRLYVSATGGATQTETLAAAAQVSGTAAPLCPLPACWAPGVAIVLTALPATTAAGPPQGTAAAATSLASAHTTVVIKQTGIPPTMLPFNDTAAPGFFPVTVTSATTLAAGFDVMGELQYQAGFFNNLGGKYQICGGGVTTPSAATVAGTWALRIGPRENSAGTSGEHIAVPWGFVASRQWTAAASVFTFCTDLTVTTIGTSGVVEGGASSFCVVVAAGDDGAGVDTCVGAFNAAATATDLTAQGVIQLSYVQTAASWTVPQLRYLTIRKL